MLTALSRTIREEKFAALGAFVSVPHQAYCYDFGANEIVLYFGHQFEENTLVYAREYLRTEQFFDRKLT